MKNCVLHILIVVLSYSQSESVLGQSREYINLNENWVVSEAESGTEFENSIPVDFQNPGKDWFKATMPKQVQDILFEMGIIPDPHVGTNPTKCTWIFEKDWIYATRFASPKNNGDVFLCFDGIDTRADIWVNGNKIGACANMFRKYRFQINNFLKNDGSPNVLSVFVYSPAKLLKDIEEQKADSEVAAHKYLRKTGSDFSAYMGARPNFLKMGIYKNVYLDIPRENFLGDVYVRTTLNQDYSKAQIIINPDIQGEGTPKLGYSLLTPSGKLIAKAMINNCDSFSINVDKPELWQPYTHGKPSLYKLTVSLINENKEIDSKEFSVGIREVQLVQQDEKTGEARFGFKINGQMIFMRGACWAPLEGMTHVWDNQRAAKLLDIFQAGNMNFIRVWGEGSLPDDWFYDECDRRGILVWQEFMTGNGMNFPLNYKGFAENIRAEITDNILRFRNHPSIIIWCGGNEHYLGQKVIVENKKDPLGRELFEEIMPQLAKEYDPSRIFHPSSPWGGEDWHNGNSPLEGDWHDYATIRFMPLATVPLFTTEVCMVSPYSVNSMRNFMSEEELWPAGFKYIIDKPGKIGWPEAWEYHTTGNGWQKLGRIQDYLDVQNADDLCRVTGSAHGEYLKERYESSRRGVVDGQPDGNRRSWGTAIWRFNDTWPMIYMSVVDYYLEPKIPYYFLKRACEPILISFEQTAEKICVWVVNDSPDAVNDSLIVELRNFNGKLIKRVTQEVALNAGEAKRVLDLTQFGEIQKRNEYLTGRFGNQTISHLLYTEKFLNLPDAEIKIEKTSSGIIIKSDKFVKEVALTIPNTSGAVFDDNYFNLLPGESKHVKILDSAGGSSIKAKGVNSSELELYF